MSQEYFGAKKKCMVFCYPQFYLWGKGRGENIVYQNMFLITYQTVFIMFLCIFISLVILFNFVFCLLSFPYLFINNLLDFISFSLVQQVEPQLVHHPLHQGAGVQKGKDICTSHQHCNEYKRLQSCWLKQKQLAHTIMLINCAFIPLPMFVFTSPIVCRLGCYKANLMQPCFEFWSKAKFWGGKCASPPQELRFSWDPKGSGNFIMYLEIDSN